MSNKVIYAIYNDDDILMDAVKKTRAAHHHIEEVFTPFPVHGLDKAMGIAPTRLAICAFFMVVLELCCYSNDELYYDSGLATRYWWKT
jgi:hypothetical protein